MSVGRSDKLCLEKYGYTFQKRLGEGKYGKVMQVYSNNTRRKFAVKIINAGDKASVKSSYVTKFLPRELDILKAVKHPNITETHHIYWKRTSKVFIVMELCVNGDLSEYMEVKGPLSEECSRKFFSQLCAAMQYLHGIDVTHRDLKCSNLLLDANYNIKVCDFSMSKRLTYTDGRVDLSETFCGTKSYAAPELIRSKPYNPVMADVWSMGVILFEMLYNKLPFPPLGNLAKFVEMQMKNSVTFPDTPTVSPATVALIQSMLHPDMEHRISLADIMQSPFVLQAQDEPGHEKTEPCGKATHKTR